MGKHERMTGAERVARRRAALRVQGLRPKQFWVPDLRDPKVREEIARSVEAINRSMAESDDMAFVEAMANETLAALPPYDASESEEGGPRG